MPLFPGLGRFWRGSCGRCWRCDRAGWRFLLPIWLDWASELRPPPPSTHLEVGQGRWFSSGFETAGLGEGAVTSTLVDTNPYEAQPVMSALSASGNRRSRKCMVRSFQSSREADRLPGYMQFPSREGQQFCSDDFSATIVSPRFPEKAVFSQNSERDKRNGILAHEAK